MSHALPRSRPRRRKRAFLSSPGFGFGVFLFVFLFSGHKAAATLAGIHPCFIHDERQPANHRKPEALTPPRRHHLCQSIHLPTISPGPPAPTGLQQPSRKRSLKKVFTQTSVRPFVAFCWRTPSYSPRPSFSTTKMTRRSSTRRLFRFSPGGRRRRAAERPGCQGPTHPARSGSPRSSQTPFLLSSPILARFFCCRCCRRRCHYRPSAWWLCASSLPWC